MLKSVLITLCCVFSFVFLQSCQTTAPSEQDEKAPNYETVSADELIETTDYQDSIAPLSPAYALQNGDEIRIDVFGETELSGEHKLREDGSLTLPLIGPVHLAGDSVTETELKLTELYEDGYLIDPVISVSLLAQKPIYILGEVENPGRYDFENDLRILNAVALAGGYSFRANKNKIMLQRLENKTLRTLETVNAQTVLHPGDIITVKERFF